ncbi:MAG: TlpA family protein disulfide reductase [Anaerolineales bacterium]|nr:TlpA family protein disulfide reductase [Anaerolineales bacterium]
MKSRNTLLSLVLLLAVLLTACGSTATSDAMMEKPEDAMMEEKPEETMAEPTHDTMMDDAMATPEAMMDDKGEGEMREAPAWFDTALTDARTGQTFSINDFKGKVVLVETMAIWCSNCLKQQGQVKALHEKLGARDDFVSIGLDIDPNENIEALKSYVEDKGFDWLYAVPSADVSREIASLYGDQFLNPPSTPIVVIDRHGNAHSLPFGIKSADDLMQAIQPFLDESI